MWPRAHEVALRLSAAQMTMLTIADERLPKEIKIGSPAQQSWQRIEQIGVQAPLSAVEIEAGEGREAQPVILADFQEKPSNFETLDQHALHFVQRHVIGPAIVELSGARRAMVRHRRGRLQGATVLQIGGDPGRAETVIADRRADPGRRRAPAHHRERIGLGQGGIA